MTKKSEMIIERDIAIIGAGPVGLFSAFQCGMVGLNTVIIDSLEHSGGQCTALYPEKPIYDIPAFPSILAGDLITQLETQANAFKPSYCLNNAVTSLSGSLGGFELRTDKHNIIRAKGIIIAGGAGCFGPNKPPLDNLESFEGVSVFYSIRKKEDLRDKKIIIAGGGDSAVDWAIALVGIASEIHLVHRRDKFKAAPASLEILHSYIASGEIILHTPYQLSSINGQNGHLSEVNIADLDGNSKTIKADILLPFFGLSTNLGAIAEWGLCLHKQTITIDSNTAATNIKGIYAVGDIAQYEHKLKLILVGFSEAAQAAHALRRDLYPDEIQHFEYSTTKGVP
jgi:thioredoxin reductase (NADPH)